MKNIPKFLKQVTVHLLHFFLLTILYFLILYKTETYKGSEDQD